MAECKLCVEREKEIKRILKAYKNDKKIYRIVIISLFVLEIFTIAFGSKGLLIFRDLVMELLK